MKSNKKNTKIDFGEDDDLSLYDNPDDFGMDFDDSEMNLSNDEFGSKNRSPVVKAGTILGKTIKNTLSDEYFIRETIAEKLPKEVTTTLESFDQIGNGINQVYTEVNKNLQPGLTAAKKTLRQVVNRDSKFVPKWLNDKITEMAESDQTAAVRSVESERTDFIGAQMQELMMQNEQSAQTQLMVNTVEREKDRAIDNDRFNVTASIQQQMAQSVLNIDTFHRNFHTTYAKKSLEVGYRSLFVLQDILTQNREATKAQLEQLASISKNTSLPDYVKYRGIEVTKEMLQRGLAEKTVDPIVRKGSEITQKLFGNLTKALGNKAQEISDNMLSGTDFLQMMRDMREMDEDGFGDEMKSGVLGMLFGGKIKSAAKKGVGKAWGKFEDSKYFKPTMSGIRKTDSLLRNAPYAIQDGLNDTRYINDLHRGAELEVEDREKLLENVKKYDSGDKDLLSSQELEEVLAYKKKNIFLRNAQNVGLKAKRFGLDFADKYSDTITDGLVDNRSTVDYTQVGAGNHFTKSEDLMNMKKQVDETITKVIPKYLQHILQEITTIREFGIDKGKTTVKSNALSFDWNSGKLATGSSIAKSIQEQAYNPAKAAKLQESLARMIVAGGGMSDEAADSLMTAIMKYWQSSGSTKMGSTVELFTANYFKDQKSSSPRMQALNPEAEVWLAKNIGDKESVTENASRRTKKTSIERFEKIDKYWKEAVENRVAIDPRVIYSAARKAGYEHDHIAKGLNIISATDDKEFLGDSKFKMDIDSDTAKITDLMKQRSFTQTSKDFLNADEQARIEENQKDEQARLTYEDTKEQLRKKKEHDKFIAKNDLSPDDYNHKAKDTKPAKQKRATGGPILSAQPDGVDTDKALSLGKDVVLAGGEHVFTDKEVRAIGGGNIEEGHKRLIQFRSSIKGNTFNYKKDNIKEKLINGFSDARQAIGDSLSAAAQITSMQIHARALKKKLDSGYKLSENEIQEFSEIASKITGMSTQAVALAITYSNTDTLATRLSQLSNMADVEQIKQTIDNIANDNHDVKNIITAKDKISNQAENIYTKVKDKVNNVLGIENQKDEQAPEQLADTREVKFTRLSNNRKENQAAMLRNELEAKRKTTVTTSYLIGDREQQKVQALLDNAKYTGNTKDIEKYENILQKQYGVKSNKEKVTDAYTKIFEKVKKKDNQAEITHRDLAASIREYIDAVTSGKYIDYRANGSIARLLAKEVGSSNYETIAHMFDWTMHKSLLELMQETIPFRGKQTVDAFYEAVQALYEQAKPLADRVRSQLKEGSDSPIAKHFTAIVNDSLKTPVVMPKTLDKEESGEFKELVQACKEYVSTAGGKIQQNSLYQALAAYTGMAKIKIEMVLNRLPTSALITILTPNDGAKTLASIIHTPEKIFEYIKKGSVNIKNKVTDYRSSNSKLDFNQVGFEDYKTKPTVGDLVSNKVNNVVKTASDKINQTAKQTTEIVKAQTYKMSDDFVGPKKPSTISQVADNSLDKINESISNSYNNILSTSEKVGVAIKDLHAKTVNEFKTWIKDKPTEESNQYVSDVSNALQSAKLSSLISKDKIDSKMQEQTTDYSNIKYNQQTTNVPNDTQAFMQKQYENVKLNNDRVTKLIEQYSQHTGIEVDKTIDNSDGFEEADIYLSGQKTPVMTYKDIKSGYFADATTGNVIQKASDIKGDIIDIRTGSIVVKSDEIHSLVHVRVTRSKKDHGTFIKRGLLSRFVPFGVHASKVVGSRISAIARGQYTAVDAIKDMMLLPFKAVDALVNFALDRPADIFISDGQGGTLGEPVLTKKKMKDGEYFNADGVPIYTPTDIKGIVVDKYGDVIIDKEDLKQGLCFKNGRKIEGPWTRILKKAFRAYMAPFKWAAKATWWGMKKANTAVGWLLGKGSKGLLNLQRDKGSIEETQTEISIFSAQQLAGINEGISKINKTQDDQIKAEKSKQVRSGSWKEKLFGKKKEITKEDTKDKEKPKEESTFSKVMGFIKDWGPLMLAGAALIGPAIMGSNFGQVITKVGTGIGVAAKGIMDVASWFKDKGTSIFNNIDKLTQKVFGITTSTGAKVGVTAAAGIGAVALASKYIPKTNGAMGAIASTIKGAAGLLMKMPGAKWVAIAGILYTLSSLFGDEDNQTPGQTNYDSNTPGSSNQNNFENPNDNSGYDKLPNSPEPSTFKKYTGMDGETAAVAAGVAGQVSRNAYDKYKKVPANINTTQPVGNVFEQYAKDMNKPAVPSAASVETKPGVFSKIADKAISVKDSIVQKVSPTLSNVKDTIVGKAKNAIASTSIAADMATGGKATAVVDKVANAGSVIKDVVKDNAAKASKYLPSASTVSSAAKTAGTGLSKAGNLLGKAAGIKGTLVLAGTSLAVDAFADKGSIGGKSAIAGTGIASSAMTGATIGSFAGPIGTAVGAAVGTGYGLWSNRGLIAEAWTQWKDLDTKSIRAVRYVGYGFTGNAANALHKSLAALESICGANIQKTAVNTPMGIDLTALKVPEIARLLGLDPKSQSSLQAADIWFTTRFKPIFEAHLNAIAKTLTIDEGKYYQAFDKIDDESIDIKSRYITLVVSMIPANIPVYTLEGSSLISKTTFTNYTQVITAHKTYVEVKATNDKNQNKTIKEGITKTSGSQEGNEMLSRNYVSRGSSYRDQNTTNQPVANSSESNTVNVNMPTKALKVRDSISVAGAAKRQSPEESSKKDIYIPRDPSKSSVRVGYASERGTTEYGPSGDPNSYISGTTKIRDNRNPLIAASGQYSTQRVYNPTMRDGDDVIEDAEYYDKDITQDSKPTQEVEKGKVPGKLLGAKGSLYTGQNAKNFIVYGKNPEGIPIDLNGLLPEFRSLVLGCIEEYGSRTGKTVQINSAARSSAQQASMHKRMPTKAAPPGHSPHEFGFAIDINTADIDAMEKMGLMRKYGLCRPLSGESWHVEPIGIQLDYYRCKTDRAYATKMIIASPGRGGSGPGDTMRGKGHKVRRYAQMLKEIWEKPQMYITEDNQYADAKPLEQKPNVQQVGFSPDARKVITKTTPVATDKKTLDSDSEKPSPIVKTSYKPRTSYPNAVDQAQVATQEKPSFEWRKTSEGATPLKDFKLKGQDSNGIKEGIKEASKTFGMDSSIPLVIAQLESGMGQSVQSSTSSAKGIFQFTDATWKDALKMYIKDHGPDAGITGMENPLDNRSSILVGLNFLKRRLEKGADVQELYLRHFFGDTGYKNFKAGESAGKLPSQSVSSQAVKANVNLFYKDGPKMQEPMNYAEFSENLFKDRFVQAAAQAGLNTVPGVSSQPINSPEYKTVASKVSQPADGLKRVSISIDESEGKVPNSEGRPQRPRQSERRSAPSTKVPNYVPDKPSTQVDTESDTTVSNKAKQNVEAAKSATQYSLDPVKKVLEDTLQVQSEHLTVSKQILESIKEHVEITKSFVSNINKGSSNKDKPDTIFTPKSQTVNTRTIPAPVQFPESTVSMGRNRYEEKA
jgi:hypothetical protein